MLKSIWNIEWGLRILHLHILPCICLILMVQRKEACPMKYSALYENFAAYHGIRMPPTPTSLEITPTTRIHISGVGLSEMHFKMLQTLHLNCLTLGPSRSTVWGSGQGKSREGSSQWARGEGDGRTASTAEESFRAQCTAHTRFRPNIPQALKLNCNLGQMCIFQRFLAQLNH